MVLSMVLNTASATECCLACWALSVVLKAVRDNECCLACWELSAVLIAAARWERGAQRRVGWVSAPGLQPPVLIPLLARQHAGINLKLRSGCGRILCASAKGWDA